jgi:hypothetical protein
VKEAEKVPVFRSGAERAVLAPEQAESIGRRLKDRESQDPPGKLLAGFDFDS